MIAVAVSTLVLCQLFLLFGGLATGSTDPEEERRYNIVCLICLGVLGVLVTIVVVVSVVFT